MRPMRQRATTAREMPCERRAVPQLQTQRSLQSALPSASRRVDPGRRHHRDTHTDRQTQTTVTLAAHARRGLITPPLAVELSMKTASFVKKMSLLSALMTPLSASFPLHISLPLHINLNIVVGSHITIDLKYSAAIKCMVCCYLKT